jgi:Carboxypeptidase regulatory-like domain/TonB-dependent Receptor Plug Domain
MFRARSARLTRLTTGLALVSMTLLVSSTSAFGQASGTATIRGTVQDPSGGVLPGATVTLTNASTKGTQTAVTTERGTYTFSGVFPGTYDLKVELSGFKNYEQKAIAISPQDTRGIDVRLDVGQQAETVTVTATNEVIQTETGAREGVLTASQIDNLSVVGRSSLELLRILPGVVSPDNTAFETVTFGGGANNTQGYTVNGIRSSNNNVSLDGSQLIDIGSNSGVIVTLNNDMVQEVKVQSSNFAAEYGSGGMNISAVTKGGASNFSGTLYDYVRDHRFAANDRSNSIAGVEKPKSSFNYPGGNVGGPIIIPGLDFNTNRDKAFFFFGLEAQRQKNDPGSRFGVVPTLGQRQGDFTEFVTPTAGTYLNQPTGPGRIVVPGGFPGAGTPIANGNLAPYITSLGQVLVNSYPKPNYVDPNNRYNYVLSQLEPQNRLDMKARVDYNISANTKAYVRVAREKEEVEGARGVWWGASEVALPSPNLGTNVGRSVSGNVVSVLSPTMTNEALVSWSRLTLDNTYKDPSLMRKADLGVEFETSFPGASPYIPGVISWGGGASNLWSSANDMYAHNDELTFSNKLTKIAGAHGLKFGASASRLQKQQNFNNNEEGYFVFGDPGSVPGSSGNRVADILAGRPEQVVFGTAAPAAEYRMWNFDAFAQDSWKLRPNLTLEYGVRAGYWTNNAELNGLGAYFDESAYNPNFGQYLDPGTFQQLNGYCYVSTGCAPAGVLGNRSPFAMPRVNMAWDITGNGNNVLRGGYGLFYNRNMGNVEYDPATKLPPASYSIRVGANDAASYGGGRGLTYDTVREATLANRLGTSDTFSMTPNSFTFPKTHSFSLSYARRIFFNQVIEASYVGTRGRDLVSQVNRNAIPEGALLQGQVGNADLSNPIHRFALADAAENFARPFATLPSLDYYDFEGESNYNSMQLTLSRQTGKRLQYFVAYTLGRTKGTLGDEYRNRDPFNAARSYGIRQEDRTHILNVSWNAFLPDAAKGPLDNVIGRGLLNGWQLSGISTMASGTPIWLGFSGPAGNEDAARAYYGTSDTVLLTAQDVVQSGLAPVYTCDPRLDGRSVGDKMFDVNCIGFPAFGENGQVIPPYDLRTPTRQNHDLTLFKNFAITGQQKLQFRVGFFNIFNQAFATTNVSRNDIVLTLDTVCNRTVDNVPNGLGGTANSVCDPTAGFSLTESTKNDFGKINLLRGRRIIEFALKYYF